MRQRSRTTINDERKLWKDEQARIDTPSASLPPAVANAMVSVWALAIEHGEQVFAQRGEELETEATAAVIRAESLATANAGPQAEGHTLCANSRISRHALPRRWQILPVPRLSEMPTPGRAKPLQSGAISCVRNRTRHYAMRGPRMRANSTDCWLPAPNANPPCGRKLTRLPPGANVSFAPEWFCYRRWHCSLSRCGAQL